MTTGTRTYGDPTKPFYYYKYWNGVDGRLDEYGNSKFNYYLMQTWSVHQTCKEWIYGRVWLFDYRPHCCFPDIVSWTSNDTIELQNKLAAAVRGHTLNLGVSAATAGQSYTLIVNTVTRLTQSMRLLKKGRLGDSVRALGVSPKRQHDRRLRLPRGQQELHPKDVSAYWLEIQYGWRPLISDAYEAQKVFVRHSAKPRRVVISVSKTKRGTIETFCNTTYDPVTGWGELYSVKASQRLTYTYRYYGIEVLSSPRTLGLTDPASIAWELIPFSFVVDWFIPVGSYIEALNMPPLLDGKTYLFYANQKIGAAVGNPYPPGPPANQCEGSTANGTQNTFQRSLVTAFPVPRPVFKELDEALSPGHIKNALALMHQVFT